MTQILITGINGFVGHHLARELHKNNISVIGVGREDTIHEAIAPVVTQYFSTDLATEWPPVADVDAIIHLAGLAAVGPSFDNPQTYINLNSVMVTHMAEFYLRQDKKPRIVVVSSGAIYDADQQMPLNEASKIGYNSPYVVSKILVENQCQYYQKRGLDCVVVRPFNHIGPGQLPGFLVPDLAQQLVAAGSSGTIEVGNLTTKRDYTDVRDVARAYRLIATAERLSSSCYNVCSGSSVSGEEILTELQAALGLSDITVQVDQSRIRPTDAPDIYGDASLLNTDTGWKPEISLEQTIRDFTALL